MSDPCPERTDGGDHLYGHTDGKCRLCGADFETPCTNCVPEKAGVSSNCGDCDGS